MTSVDPLGAARSATAQLYTSDKEYQLVNHKHYGTTHFDKVLQEKSIYSNSIVSKEGNMAEIKLDDGSRQQVLVSSSDLMLRPAGSTQQAIEKNLWLFGFDKGQSV
jgi:hypothetical protein